MMRPAVVLMFLSLIAPIQTGSAAAQESSVSVQTSQAAVHELHQLLNLAVRYQQEVRRNVRDYTCLIVKRERIHGTLQSHRFIEAMVREPRREGERSSPLAVRLYFRGPQEMAGRMIIYLEGRNDGKMLVRRGGKRFGNVIVQVDPESELARAETEMHIGDMGFDHMLAEIVAHLKNDIAADPKGANTVVRVSEKARINDRSCTAVVITHPAPAEELTYHRAEFFMDNEYKLPVRVAAYDWPKSEGETPKLIAEFTYTKVKINVGLTDDDFDVAHMQTAAR